MICFFERGSQLLFKINIVDSDIMDPGDDVSETVKPD